METSSEPAWVEEYCKRACECAVNELGYTLNWIEQTNGILWGVPSDRIISFCFCLEVSDPLTIVLDPDEPLPTSPLVFIKHVEKYVEEMETLYWMKQL